MSKTLSYKGQIPIGEQERISLHTMKGKVGYKITKFQIIPAAIGAADYEAVVQIFNKTQANITNVIDFTNPQLLGAAYHKSESSSSAGPFGGEVIIFDNEVFNQDIFVTAASAGGFTNPINYFIELETVTLTDIQSTIITLRSLRNIQSR